MLMLQPSFCLPRSAGFFFFRRRDFPPSHFSGTTIFPAQRCRELPAWRRHRIIASTSLPLGI